MKLGNYTFAFSVIRECGCPRARLPAHQQAPLSYAIVISTGPDDYIDPGQRGASHLQWPGAFGGRGWRKLEEGTYVDGRWVPGRRLNGDDIMLNYDAPNKTIKNESGQGFRLQGGAPKALHLQIYGY